MIDERVSNTSSKGEAAFNGVVVPATYLNRFRDPEIAKALARATCWRDTVYQKLLDHHPDLFETLALNPKTEMGRIRGRVERGAFPLGAAEGDICENDGVTHAYFHDRWVPFPALLYSSFERSEQKRSELKKETEPAAPEPEAVPVEVAEPSAFQVIKDTIANKALSAMASQTVKALGGSEEAADFAKTAVALTSESETVQTMPVADMVSQALNGDTP